MTRQEIFNTVAQHFAVQRAPAMSETGHCVYRGASDLKCAIGALIPEHLYDKKFENASVSKLIQLYPETFLEAGLDPNDEDFLAALQCAHDSIIATRSTDNFLPIFQKNMRNVASNYALDPSALKALA